MADIRLLIEDVKSKNLAGYLNNDVCSLDLPPFYFPNKECAGILCFYRHRDYIFSCEQALNTGFKQRSRLPPQLPGYSKPDLMKTRLPSYPLRFPH